MAKKTRKAPAKTERTAAGKKPAKRAAKGRKGDAQRTATRAATTSDPATRAPRSLPMPMFDARRCGARVEKTLLRLRQRTNAQRVVMLKCDPIIVAQAVWMRCVELKNADTVAAALGSQLIREDTGERVTRKSIANFLRSAHEQYACELDREMARLDADIDIAVIDDPEQLALRAASMLARCAMHGLTDPEEYASLPTGDKNAAIRSVGLLVDLTKVLAEAKLKGVQTEEVERKIQAVLSEAERTGAVKGNVAELRRKIMDTMLVQTLGPDAAMRVLIAGDDGQEAKP